MNSRQRATSPLLLVCGRELLLVQHLGAPEDLLDNARQQILLQRDSPNRVLPGLVGRMAAADGSPWPWDGEEAQELLRLEALIRFV